MKRTSYRKTLQTAIAVLYLAPLSILYLHLFEKPQTTTQWLQMAGLLVWAVIGWMIFNLLLQNWEEQFQQLAQRASLNTSRDDPAWQHEIQQVLKNQETLLAQRDDRQQMAQWQQTLEAYRQEHEKKVELLQRISIESKKKVQQLEILLEEKKVEIDRMQSHSEDLAQQVHQYNGYKHLCEQQQQQLEDSQQLMTVQEETIKRQEKKIALLEIKVHDLNYEIRTLLDLNPDQKQP